MELNVGFITKRRKQLNMKVSDIAEKIGYGTPSGFSNLMKRKSIMNNSRKLRKLAEVLKCKEKDLFE